jgi:hypothetical protein
MEAAGYTHDVPRPVPANQEYHRFVPPLGTRRPQVGVTAVGGRIRRKHVAQIKAILDRFKSD